MAFLKKEPPDPKFGLWTCSVIKHSTDVLCLIYGKIWWIPNTLEMAIHQLFTLIWTFIILLAGGPSKKTPHKKKTQKKGKIMGCKKKHKTNIFVPDVTCFVGVTICRPSKVDLRGPSKVDLSALLVGVVGCSGEMTVISGTFPTPHTPARPCGGRKSGRRTR